MLWMLTLLLEVYLYLRVVRWGLTFLNTMRNPDYNAYNHARSQLLDYGMPDYYANEKAFAQLGMNENDYKMLQSWTFDDPEFFTTEKFKEIAALKDNKFDILNTAKNTFDYVIKSIFQTGSSAFFFLIVSCWLFFLKKNRGIPITMTFIIIAVYFYLCSMGRVMDRVEQALWFAGVYALVLNLNVSIIKTRSLSKKRIIIVTCIAALLWNGNSIMDNCINATKNIHAANDIQVADRLSNDKNNLYLVDTVTMDVIQNAISPFKTDKEGFYSNLYTLGGWATRLPLKKESLDTYGITNPLKDSVNKNNIYYVDYGDFTYKYNYIKEHYYPDLMSVKTKDLGLCQVYKLYQHIEDIPKDIAHIDQNRIHLDDLMKTQDQEYLHFYGKLNVDDIDTFEQEIFVKTKNLDSGEEKTYQATTYVDDDNRAGYNMMSKNVLDNFMVEIPNQEISSNHMEFQIILKHNNQYYKIKTMKLDSLES